MDRARARRDDPVVIWDGSRVGANRGYLTVEAHPVRPAPTPSRAAAASEREAVIGFLRARGRQGALLPEIASVAGVQTVRANSILFAFRRVGRVDVLHLGPDEIARLRATHGALFRYRYFLAPEAS